MSSGAPPPVLSPFPLISTQFSKHWRTQTGLVVIYTQHQRRVPHTTPAPRTTHPPLHATTTPRAATGVPAPKAEHDAQRHGGRHETPSCARRMCLCCAHLSHLSCRSRRQLRTHPSRPSRPPSCLRLSFPVRRGCPGCQAWGRSHHASSALAPPTSLLPAYQRRRGRGKYHSRGRRPWPQAQPGRNPRRTRPPRQSGQRASRRSCRRPRRFRGSTSPRAPCWGDMTASATVRMSRLRMSLLVRTSRMSLPPRAQRHVLFLGSSVRCGPPPQTPQMCPPLLCRDHASTQDSTQAVSRNESRVVKQAVWGAWPSHGRTGCARGFQHCLCWPSGRATSGRPASRAVHVVVHVAATRRRVKRMCTRCRHR